MHIFYHSFRFAQGTNKSWKKLCSSILWVIILIRNGNILQSTEGGVANLFRPRILICAVILSSTNKWDFEPGLLSLVINHVYSVAGWQSLLLFLFYKVVILIMKLKYSICCGLDVHKNVIVATIVTTGKDGISEYKQKSFSMNFQPLFKQWIPACSP